MYTGVILLIFQELGNIAVLQIFQKRAVKGPQSAEAHDFRTLELALSSPTDLVVSKECRIHLTLGTLIRN